MEQIRKLVSEHHSGIILTEGTLTGSCITIDTLTEEQQVTLKQKGAEIERLQAGKKRTYLYYFVFACVYRFRLY